MLSSVAGRYQLLAAIPNEMRENTAKPMCKHRRLPGSNRHYGDGRPATGQISSAVVDRNERAAISEPDVNQLAFFRASCMALTTTEAILCLRGPSLSAW